MCRFFLYICMFIIGFTFTFFISDYFKARAVLENKKNMAMLEKPSSPVTSKNEAATENLDNKNNTTDEIDMNNEDQEIEMMVDISLPSLVSISKSLDKLKKACKISYPQYQNKNRYQWVKSYTLSKSQTKKSIDFYIQEDMWSSFLKPQQKRIMEDLYYCDPVSQNNKNLRNLRILSPVDDAVLSSYTAPSL